MKRGQFWRDARDVTIMSGLAIGCAFCIGYLLIPTVIVAVLAAVGITAGLAVKK